MRYPTRVVDAAIGGALSALFIAPFIAVHAKAAEVHVQAGGPVVEVAASAAVLSKPDETSIGAGVTTRSQTAVQATRLNANKMTAVIARIKALGVAAEDIQTSGISLSPAYQYNPSGQNTFLGYDVGNQVLVTLHRTDGVGDVLDALVAAGATNINGPTFRASDDSKAVSEARKGALEDARAQALEHARLAGYSGVKLLAVEEGERQSGPSEIVVTGSRRVAALAIQSATPVEPGRVATQVRIVAKFEMTR